VLTAVALHHELECRANLTGEPIWVQTLVGDGRCGLERIFRDLSGSGGKRHRRSDLLAGISWSHGLAAGDQAEGK
jgi:hypothetical protein